MATTNQVTLEIEESLIQQAKNAIQLVKDYESLMLEIAPHTYNHGRRARALRQRTKELLGESETETPELRGA